MAPAFIPIRPIAYGLAALPAVYLAGHIYARVSAVSGDRIATSTDVAGSLRESATVRKLVNPRDSIMRGDCQSIDLDVSPKASLIKDEALLAAFTRGFFSGSVFGPERLALRVARPALLNFPGT